MNNSRYYNNYSIDMQRFLKALGFRYLAKRTHSLTKRDFWVYLMTDEFSQALLKYSENRDKIKEENKKYIKKSIDNIE